jgi:formylglycine-generating enzyme required for sulfatase activity
LPADRDAQIAALKCDSDLEQLSTWTDSPGDSENRPITCLSWYDAMAFCAWDGGFLPTNAEWNLAAAGGSEQRAYPWSSPPSDLTIDPAHASYADDNGHCLADGQPACTSADMRPVGSDAAGDGRWGHSDLAGNAAEWTLDFSQSAYITPCVDCADLSGTTLRDARGGTAVTFASTLRTGARLPRAPGRRESVSGVRCARAM